MKSNVQVQITSYTNYFSVAPGRVLRFHSLRCCMSLLFNFDTGAFSSTDYVDIGTIKGYQQMNQRFQASFEM